MLRLLCDQNIRIQTAAFLRGLGHDVRSTRDLGLGRAEDAQILEAASLDGRTIVTFDGDFSDIRFYPIGRHAGIIRLRIHPQVDEVVHPILTRALAGLTMERVGGKLVTITPLRVRIRG